jgi:hypothetical protein
VGSNERFELRLGKPLKSEARVKFAYVYILQSLPAPEHYYFGFTQALHDRLRRHDSGEWTVMGGRCRKAGKWESGNGKEVQRWLAGNLRQEGEMGQ